MTLRDGFPPFYPERPSSVIFELNQVILGYVAAALFVGLLLILPGVRGKDRLFFLFRWTASLFVGVTIIACVQGNSWHEAAIDTVLPYQTQTNEMARFEIGLKIGLSTFNITLKGDLDDTQPHKIVFSEQFYFLQSDEELDRGLRIGLPFPILNVLEHFSVNKVSSLWLWGRRYWIAGHYASYMLWSAFASWITANILLHTVLRYGGLVTIFTGLLMLGANASFTSIRDHGCNLEIHLGYYEPAVLKPANGWCFWLCLGVGVMCVLLGSIISIADSTCQKSLRRFFSMSREEEIDFTDVCVDKLYDSPRRCSEKPDCFECKTNLAYQNSEEVQSSLAALPGNRKRSESLAQVKEEEEAVFVSETSDDAFTTLHEIEEETKFTTVDAKNTSTSLPLAEETQETSTSEDTASVSRQSTYLESTSTLPLVLVKTGF